jgi:hypothetical protein
MPYYRVTVILRDKPFVQGIKHYENSNIDAVTNIVRANAKKHYGEHQVVDVEAAMLSNHATAVKVYQEKERKKTDKKKWGETKPPEPAKKRKDLYGPSEINLEQRNKKE